MKKVMLIMTIFVIVIPITLLATEPTIVDTIDKLQNENPVLFWIIFILVVAFVIGIVSEIQKSYEKDKTQKRIKKLEEEVARCKQRKPEEEKEDVDEDPKTKSERTFKEFLKAKGSKEREETLAKYLQAEQEYSEAKKKAKTRADIAGVKRGFSFYVGMLLLCICAFPWVGIIFSISDPSLSDHILSIISGMSIITIIPIILGFYLVWHGRKYRNIVIK